MVFRKDEGQEYLQGQNRSKDRQVFSWEILKDIEMREALF